MNASCVSKHLIVTPFKSCLWAPAPLSSNHAIKSALVCAAASALAIARDREYREVVAAIEEAEDRRRKEMSGPNATISPVQDQVTEAISNGDNMAAIRLLDSDRSLIHACDRN